MTQLFLMPVGFTGDEFRWTLDLEEKGATLRNERAEEVAFLPPGEAFFKVSVPGFWGGGKQIVIKVPPRDKKHQFEPDPQVHPVLGEYLNRGLACDPEAIRKAWRNGLIFLVGVVAFLVLDIIGLMWAVSHEKSSPLWANVIGKAAGFGLVLTPAVLIGLGISAVRMMMVIKKYRPAEDTGSESDPATM